MVRRPRNKNFSDFCRERVLPRMDGNRNIRLCWREIQSAIGEAFGFSVLGLERCQSYQIFSSRFGLDTTDFIVMLFASALCPGTSCLSVLCFTLQALVIEFIFLVQHRIPFLRRTNDDV